MSEQVEEDKPPRTPPPRRRARTPTILQMEAVECGAAALAIVLAYYGRWIPLEQLRHECGVSRDGSKASNMLKAARHFGLDAKAFAYRSLEKLYEFEFPLILFWNFNHFVVLEGFKGDKVYLNDPATGPRVIDMEELDCSFSGVLLSFKPEASFQKGGVRPSIVAALARRLRGSEVALLFTVLCGLTLVIPGLVIPTFTRLFIDDFLVGGQGWIVIPLLWSMAAAMVIQAILKWLQEYYLLRLETRLALGTSKTFFEHIIRLPAAYFGQRFAGEIGSRLQINDKVAKVISGRLAATTVDLVMTVFYAVLMFLYDAKLTATVVVLSLVNVGVVRGAARWRVDASRRLMQDKGKQTGTAMGGLQMIETLKATGSESEFFARWAGYHGKTLNGEQSLGFIGQVVSAVPPLVETTSRAAVLVLGGLKVMGGDLTMGMLVAYQTLLTSFTRPLANFVQFGSMVQELQADMNRLDDVLQNPIDAQYAKDTPKETFPPSRIQLTGRVEFQDVTFGYSPREDPLIEGFNLVIEPGQRVALVGGSGSGKSTVARLASGLYTPWSGEIRFDGVDRQRIPRQLLVSSIAVVDQEIFLFGGTVTENISMWDPGLDQARIQGACVSAAIHDDIMRREGGYRAGVQEGGTNFSGGQCQRLEISRALVRRPTILILDEATSALDPTTEKHIDEAIRRQGCTTITIAHRLSTIRDSDLIIVLEHGKEVQRGTHDQMIKIEDSPYKRLISM